MTFVHSFGSEDNGVVSTHSQKNRRGTKMEISRVCFSFLEEKETKQPQQQHTTTKKWKSQSMNHARTSHLSIRQGGVEYRS